MLPKLTTEQKETVVRNIQGYFETEREESLGELAAMNLLDFMMKELGPLLYNSGVRDARATLMDQMGRLEEELYALEQPVRRNR